MAWVSSQVSSRRPLSPKRYFPARRTRSSWTSPRRSRLLSWSLCVLVLIAIVLWPRKRDHYRHKAPPKQKRPAAVVPPRPRREDDLPVYRKTPKKQGTSVVSEDHVYRADGLLDINPRGRHPILELIERSEIQWKRKVERQSKSLKQAVNEYKRRYKRPPPRGFEIWWDYVDFHDVKLVDEYDSIHIHLQPFWGVEPSILRRNQAAWETHTDTFTIGKLPDTLTVELLNHTLHDDFGYQRAQDQLDLLEDVQEWLPEFRATFSIHDGPTQFVSWELRKAAEEAAERGEYIDVPRVAASTTAKGWAAACPPNSPIHFYVPPPLPSSIPAAFMQPLSPKYPPSASSSKSFIYNHPLSMSPCLHPTHITLNGYLSQYRYPHQIGPTPSSVLAPIFGICTTAIHNDILTVAPEQFTESLGVDPLWGDKVDQRLLWRGRNTGVLHQSGNEWNLSQRIRLVELGTRRGGETNVLLPRGPTASAGDGGTWNGAVGYGETVSTSALNAAFMDVAFVGKPIQCREPVCTDLQRMFEWRTYQSWRDAWVYKYIIDVDGNGWSARFKRLMTSNSLIFKSTMFPEWYTERIMPWVHYIPVQVDFSDIYDILAFFRGDLSGAGAHDDLAERIATAGKTWSNEFYRKEDMTAYQFRLFLEYARVMSLDRDVMSYQEDGEYVDDDE